MFSEIRDRKDRKRVHACWNVILKYCPHYPKNVSVSKEVNKEDWTTINADRIWNLKIYIPNQISHLKTGKDIYFICLLLLIELHAQYFALINLILKLQFCAEASWEFLINLLVRVKIICFVRDLRNKHRQIFEGRESSSQSPGSSLAEEYSRDNPQNIKSVVNQAPGATSQQNTSDHQTTESRGCLDPGKNHMFCLNIECARSKKCCDICIFRPSVTLPSWHPWHVSSTAATCLTHVSHNRSTRCICRWSSTRVRVSLGLCSSGNNYQFLPRLYHRDNNIIK